MNNDRPVKSGSSSQLRNHLLIGLGWLVSASLLTFNRLTHPAFGIQGDLPIHYHFIRSFTRSFTEGDWLPRWAGVLDGGRGDALFTFYPPLSYLISAILIKSFGIEILTSLKLILLLALILGQLSAYLLARAFFDRRRSLLVSLVYVLLPAFPMIALHRAFVANALALGLAPMVILGAHLALTGKPGRRGLIIFALSFSAVILTHTITTLLCGIVIGIMGSLHLIRFGREPEGRRGLARLAGAGLLVFALTAFFLWPQQVERNWVQLGLQIAQHDYRNYFLFATPSDDSRYRLTWADINHIMSLITIAQTLTAVVLGIVCSRVLRSRPATGEKAAVIRLSLGFAILGFFISLPVSEPVWRYLPGFKFIQFPWRFQPFVALACGLLAAAAWDEWKQLNRHLRNLLAALLTWLILANAVFTVLLSLLAKPGVTQAQVIELLNSPAPAASAVTRDGPGSPLSKPPLTEDEIKNIPRIANQLFFRPPGADGGSYPPAADPGGLTFITGRGRIISQRLRISDREFNLENDEPVRARIETYYYPHWVARLDGHEVRIDLERTGSPSGLMAIDLPAGRHQLTLSFEVKNRSEIMARTISLIAWLLFLAWIIFKTAKYAKHAKE